MSTSEVLIVGAGPFGLSIAAHLRGSGVDYKIAGRPMDTWRTHMPTGMLMKSEPYASEIASPTGGYGVGEYSRLYGLDYVDRVGPLTLEKFLSYADWYTRQLVPDVQNATVTDVRLAADELQVRFADAEPVTARQVVIATGVLPYAHIPAELSTLPADLVTHTADIHNLDRFRGQRVAVIGAGQSALETAALLSEASVDVRLIARRPELSWNEPNPAHISRLGRIRRPVTQLCEGWHCAFWNSPGAFRRLPKDMRITKARTVLGPSGSWWLKDRVDGVIEVLTGHQVREANVHGDGVRLLIDGSRQSAMDVDHVIAGTGFRINLTRLPFLSAELRTRVATINGYPVVTRAAESTVPGLYFVGAPTAVSLGPSARFIAGTHNIAGKVARTVIKRAETGKSRARRPEAVPAAQQHV
jgi:thioredoxin reductase